MGSVDLTLLIDLFGLVFDSTDGTPVSGARHHRRRGHRRTGKGLW